MPLLLGWPCFWRSRTLNNVCASSRPHCSARAHVLRRQHSTCLHSRSARCNAVARRLGGGLNVPEDDDLSERAAAVPAWLPSLVPDVNHALMLRRDPKLGDCSAADAAANLAALQSLMGGERDVKKMVVLAPELLRQKAADTRQLLERLRSQFPSSDVCQMAYNRPQLLLVRSSAGMLEEWSKRPRKVVKTKKAPPSDAGSADGDAPEESEEEIAVRKANEEASAAARKAIKEILAAGGPMPRGFGARAGTLPPPVASTAQKGGSASRRPESSPPDEDDDEELDATDELEVDDNDDSDGAGDEPLSDADMAEFEAALEAATRRAREASAKEREAMIAQIEARWAARRGGGGTGGAGEDGSPSGSRQSRRSKSKGAGAGSKQRREREKLLAPWLAAPWARQSGKKPPPVDE